MAITGASVLYGTSAAVGVALPSGMGGLMNSFTYNLSQSAAEATGFGFQDAFTRGAVRRATGTVSGHPVTGQSLAPGTTSITQASQPTTLTYTTGNTMAFNAVYTQISLGVALEATDTLTYGFTRDGATTETWT